MVKDSVDPQKPLNAYNWYIKENREKIRAQNPTWNFTEITKKLAQDWKSLTAAQKQQYTDSAEVDKERYARELSAYKQSDAYRSFIKNQKNKDSIKKLKENSNNSLPEDLNQDKNDGTGFDIPIFTEEFLDHNKLREAELRQLRKSNTDYEQQNSILEKLIENTKTAISKLEEETVQQRCHNQALQQHLDQMRVTLTDAFKEISLPGTIFKGLLMKCSSYFTFWIGQYKKFGKLFSSQFIVAMF